MSDLSPQYVLNSSGITAPVQQGQTTAANSIPVVLPTDQTFNFPTSGIATKSSVAGAASDTQLLAANTSRKSALFFNESTAILYLSLGTVAASTTSYTHQVGPNGLFELPIAFTGQIRGIWSAANGNVRITELT